MRQKLRIWLLACIAGYPTAANAQDHEFPLLNSLGRQLGMGYSHTGYHARIDGRRRPVAPAQNYGSYALQYPYSPHYQPQRPLHVPTAYAPQVQVSPQSTGEMPTAAPELPEKPKQPLKPKTPPPTWLKPYLGEGEEEQDSLEAEQLPLPREAPSLRKEELTPADSPLHPDPDGEAPFYLGPDEPGRSAPSPSDRSLPEDDLLLDDEDDLLLLDDENLSAQRFRSPQIRNAEPTMATRYRPQAAQNPWYPTQPNWQQSHTPYQVPRPVYYGQPAHYPPQYAAPYAATQTPQLQIPAPRTAMQPAQGRVAIPPASPEHGGHYQWQQRYR